MHGGCKLYAIAFAIGGTPEGAHRYATDRMVQAGAVLMTWQQVMLEWQCDWTRKSPRATSM